MKMGRFLSTLLAVMMTAACAWGQYSGPNAGPGEGQPSNGDQPQTDVARVSMIHGDISMQRADTGDWSAATLNTPLVRGDQVSTGEKSRAEIQLDYANILRLSSTSQVKIADLTRTHIQLQVSQGYVNFSTFKGSEADTEIDTPNVSVRPLRQGRYRVQVNSEAETDVIVRDGQAEVTTPQGSVTVKEGQMITVRGVDNPEYKVVDAPSGDDWDRFNKDRDNIIRQAGSWGKTNQYYTGAHDLDAYGHWVYVPGYGDVWQPYQQASWAPYQAGRWVWEPYWGWTWVSYEPWGWAPYHYGRWFCYNSAWVWWPGPIHAYYRPIWAPAFVTFIGFGRGVGFGVGFGYGSIGWLPVGPHDYFYPWYGRGFNRVNVVNITNINVRNVTVINGAVGPLGPRGAREFSNMNLAFRDARVRGSITTVSSNDFGRGVMTSRRMGVNEAELHGAGMMTANVPVVPTRESLHAGGGAQVGAGVQARSNERFFTRTKPPSGPPSFNDQAAQMRQVVQTHGEGSPDNGGRSGNRMGGGPTGVDKVNNGGRGNEGNRTFGGATNTQVQTGGEGNRMKQPATGVDKPAGGNETQRSDGWRGFGGNGRGQQNTTAGSTSGDTNKGRQIESTGNNGGNSGNTGNNGGRMSGGNMGNPQYKTGGEAGGGSAAPREDRGNWSKFGGRDSSQGGTQNSGGQQNNDSGRSQRMETTTPQDRGNGRGNNSRYEDRSSYKPPLEMNKPVVTPREERHASAPAYSTPQSSYHPAPEVHSAPPAPSRGSSGYSGGGGGKPGGGNAGGGSHNSGGSSAGHSSSSSSSGHSSGSNGGHSSGSSGKSDSGSGKHQR